MISIILYGRNDNYGYNLHKRAALSLNCMAEVLTDPSDEILFVDYNTPDDFPTFPEAIQDTLTKRAREMLRILRVRPHIHARFTSRTRLLALEPIARNVAVRRSRPSNRWILSTNTDMIFVPQGTRSLSKIARDLAPGFYHAPRIEIPEVLWESFDRHAPVDVINMVREWGTTLHLNEIVLGSKFIRYDGPGDFQLLLRSDLFENHGFDEAMLLGWHVDSNIAARMLLKYDQVGDLGQHVYGYHCDHTRQITPAHSHARVQNDWKRFVTDVANAEIPQQAASWGCASDPIEEVRLASNPASVYVQALRDVIGGPLAVPNIVKYTGETYNKVDYDPRHLMPFLADLFVSLPRNSNVGWYGAREETLRLFAGIWERLSFTGKILMDQTLMQQDRATTAIHHVRTTEVLAEADVFLFDFGGLPPSTEGSTAFDPVSGELRRSFRRVVREERHRLSTGVAPRRVIALNAINNEYEWFVCGCVAAAATPFATHMRHGFVLPGSGAREDWLPLLSIGEAGVRTVDQIRNDPTKLGWIAYGPHKYLEEGRYLVSMEVELVVDEPDRPKNEPVLFVEMVAGSELLGVHLLRHWHLHNADHKFAFTVSQDIADGIAGIEARIAVLGRIGIAVRSLTVEPASASIEFDDKAAAVITIPDLLGIDDWLPFLRIGPLGRWDELGVNAEIGASEFVIFGPYWSLPAGSYEMIAYIERCHEHAIPEHLIRVDVVVADRPIAAGVLHSSALPYDENRAASVLRLPFELRAEAPEQRQIQIRIWSSGEERFRIRSLSVKPFAAQQRDNFPLEQQRQRENVFPFLGIGEVGRRMAGKVRNLHKRVGFVAYTEAITLEPGAYRLSLQITIETDDRNPRRRGRTCMIVLARYKSDIIAITHIPFGADQNESHELIFDVPSDRGATTGVELLLRVVAPANITLHTLTLEPVETEVRQRGPAVCELKNWLPFLETKLGAYADDRGVVVRKGRAGYAVYGPYWTLPAGRYEMIASIVPPASNPDGKPVITLDVTAEGGQRLVASCQWRLGQIQHPDAHTAAECRLPFTLVADLPAALRTIETRIYTPGGGGFRIRSLAVRVRSDEPERDWFPYLTVGKCGIHTGGEIKSIENEVGCIAHMPPLDIEFGHYELFLNVVSVSTNDPDLCSEGRIAIEIWSGSQILAVQICRPQTKARSDPPVRFDLTKEIASGTGIELIIRALTPAAVAIRELRVARTSNKIAPSQLPAMLSANDWLEFFRVGAAGVRPKRGVLAQAGKAGSVGSILLPLSPGRYEVILNVKRIGPGGEPAGRVIITAGENLLGSRHIVFLPRLLGPIPIPRGPLRICCFKVPVGLTPEARGIQIRIDSTGAGAFLIRSMAVKPKTPLRDLRDKAYEAAAKIFRKLRGAV
jgi:hypothetical protein